MDIKVKGFAYVLEVDMGLAGNVINDIPDILLPAATDEVLLRCSMLGEKQWKCIISNPILIEKKISLMIPQYFLHLSIFQAPSQQYTYILHQKHKEKNDWNTTQAFVEFSWDSSL